MPTRQKAFRFAAKGKTHPEVHVYGKGVICDTDRRGHETPRGRSNLEIVLDASEGFIPLWTKGMRLRWRFRDSTLRVFEDPAAARKGIRTLLGEALLAWGDASPVKFTEKDDASDFEITTRKTDDCDASGCTLASAFFPDAGRHKLVLYPQLFEYDKKEQVATLVHEIGHIFGLRHFFANISEKDSPSKIFGKHKRFSIMNYGPAGNRLTAADRTDLKRLYQEVWSGALTRIGGTPIRLVKPFHMAGSPAEGGVAVVPL